MRNLLIAIVALIVIGGGAYFLTKGNTKTESVTNQQTSQTSQDNNNKATQKADATITYDGNGFSPSTVTVKAGATILIKNTSSDPLQLNSDPHPTHTDDEELNVGAIDAGSSQTFTVSKTGTHGYHNHLNPGQRGTIVVQ